MAIHFSTEGHTLRVAVLQRTPQDVIKRRTLAGKAVGSHGSKPLQDSGLSTGMMASTFFSSLTSTHLQHNPLHISFYTILSHIPFALTHCTTALLYTHSRIMHMHTLHPPFDHTPTFTPTAHAPINTLPFHTYLQFCIQHMLPHPHVTFNHLSSLQLCHSLSFYN